jgi:probable H4MPT-linked C1 transfer pathway protein
MICMTHSIGAKVSDNRRAVPAAVIGWDIGGVNTKAVRWPDLAVRSAPYEIQRDPGALVPTLLRLAAELEAGPDRAHAVTMTAELSQAFRTKREGVAFVLDAVERAFPASAIGVFGVSGEFLTPDEARRRPLEVAASNWAATARLVAETVPDCILVDIGTTSTDIIPIAGGRVVPLGWTDPDRLLNGELVYTGAVRTPAEAVSRAVPLRGAPCPVSAEGFALIGDAHLWCGRLRDEDYTAPTPDGRPATRELAGERLARVVCGDREMLAESDIDAIARALVEAQLRTVTEAIRRVRHRHRKVAIAVVTGLGDWIAADAAYRAGLEVRHLGELLGEAARTAPAAAVACLYAPRVTPD